MLYIQSTAAMTAPVERIRMTTIILAIGMTMTSAQDLNKAALEAQVETAKAKIEFQKAIQNINDQTEGE